MLYANGFIISYFHVKDPENIFSINVRETYSDQNILCINLNGYLNAPLH